MKKLYEMRQDEQAAMADALGRAINAIVGDVNDFTVVVWPTGEEQVLPMVRTSKKTPRTFAMKLLMRAVGTLANIDEWEDMDEDTCKRLAWLVSEFLKVVDPTRGKGAMGFVLEGLDEFKDNRVVLTGLEPPNLASLFRRTIADLSSGN